MRTKNFSFSFKLLFIYKLIRNQYWRSHYYVAIWKCYGANYAILKKTFAIIRTVFVKQGQPCSQAGILVGTDLCTLTDRQTCASCHRTFGQWPVGQCRSHRTPRMVLGSQLLHATLPAEREANLLFNNALNKFKSLLLQALVWTWGKEDCSYSKRGNPLPLLQGLLSIKGSFICTILQLQQHIP